jgi:hypothetical protein
MCQKPERQPPFNIVEYQDNLQAAMQQMQGGGVQGAQPEEVEDQEVDDLAAQQQKQRDSDIMTVRN